MANCFLINHSLEGFKTIEISELDLGDEDRAILVVDNSLDDKITEYYKRVLESLSANKKLALITIEKCELGKQLACLMAAYRNYNIYEVLDSELITREYIENVLSREPSFDEIKNFLDSEISNYSELSDLLLDLGELVKQDDVEAIKQFISKNVKNLSECAKLLDYLKSIVSRVNLKEYEKKIEAIEKSLEEITKERDEANTKLKEAKDSLIEAENKQKSIQSELENLGKERDEAKGKVADLESQIEKAREDAGDAGAIQKKLADKEVENKALSERLQQEIESREQSNKQLESEKADKEKAFQELDRFKAELDSLQVRYSDLEKQKLAENGNYMVFRNYISLNTARIQCKTKAILYFKEISKIPYINSLVIAIMNYLDMQKINVKLLIYDNPNGFSAMYNPLNIVNSAEYFSKRESYITKTPQFVVAEPNQAIIDDILKSNNPVFDVVIIYDRMKQMEDIVIGNNAYKYWVVNSRKEIEELSKLTKINKSEIITRTSENRHKEFLDIGEVEDYADATSSARFKKYLTLKTSKGIGLMDAIFKKSNIHYLVKK